MDGIWFTAALTIIGIGLSFSMLQPFLKPLAGAVFIAVASYPLHIWIRREVPGENRPALITTLVVLLAVILPAVLLTGTALRQARGLAGRVGRFVQGGGIDRLLDRLVSLNLDRFGVTIPTTDEIRGWLLSHAEALSQASLQAAGSVIGNVTAMFVTLTLGLFFLFFCLRDGPGLFRRLASMAPIKLEYVNRLADTVHNTMRANVYGIIAVGIAQGAVTSGMFTILGLPGPAFWGVCAGIASMLPPFGSALIWAPGAIYLMATGSITKGVILAAVGSIGISSLDNIIRPLVIQGRVQMNTLTVLLSLLGGLQAFGILGLFAGPVIFTVTLELIKILREEIATSRS